jgi:DNA polymerase III subunit epsilon
VVVREGFKSLGEMEETEEDLLDRAWGLEPNSRLSCQAFVAKSDLVIEIPRYTINHAKENCTERRRSMRQIVLDTETTGLSAEGGDRIIELGCVELYARKLTGNNLHFYFNPERDSHEDALKVHGISNEFLRDKPKFAQLTEDILDYLADAELIIHNAAFDIGFLNKELERVGKKPLKAYVSGVIDTLAMAKEMFPGKRNSLDSLCDRLEVDNSGRTLHGALLDAELLADVYINMTRGQEALLIDAGDAPTDTQSVKVQVNLSTYALPVLPANAQELAAHDDVLTQLDKSSGGKTVWRLAQSA